MSTLKIVPISSKTKRNEGELLLYYWEQISGQKTCYCKVNHCLDTALIGVRIQYSNRADENTYILPICKGHAVSQNPLDVSGSYTLVKYVASNLLRLKTNFNTTKQTAQSKK